MTTPNLQVDSKKTIKTSSDWLSLFAVSSQDSTEMYYSGSTYNTSGSTPPSLRKYGSQSSFRDNNSTSSYYSSSSSSSRDYRSAYTNPAATYYSRSSGRPFTSRFLRSRFLSSSDEESDDVSKKTDDVAKKEGTSSNGDAKDNKEVVIVDRPTVLNGSVIRIRRRQEVSSSEDEEDEEEEQKEVEEETVKEPSVEPEPEPVEDPLEKEERELSEQLMLSLTLTLVDEENIRQRLLEIRKTRLRLRERETTEVALVQRFQKVADVALFENQAVSSSADEERILIQRLECETLSDVDRKDSHVRLQEIFRDQRNAFDKSLREVELHYEHILQETSTELTELETSLRLKSEQVQKLQDEMLTMTVRKELLSKGMEQVNDSHSERVSALNDSISAIEKKMSDYAIIVIQANPSSNSSDQIEGVRAEELRELERELECPVCMDISQPPIYQCEEGHIICSNCKPLLTNCPHNCGQRYSEPAIRCRFAEKLAERYFKTLLKHRKEAKANAEK